MTPPSSRPRLGQHFLIDEAPLEAIIETLEPADFMIEVGPGRGALTHRLAQRSKQLLALEKDPKLAAALQRQFQQEPHVSIQCVDALTVDVTRYPAGLQLVGNLPYNIATALLRHWLRARTHIRSLTVMVQREVAHRLHAAPGESQRGQLSVIMQLLMEVQLLLDVPPECFDPPPAVMSTVVRLTPRASLPIAEPDAFGAFTHTVQQAFSSRRKTLRNNFPEVPPSLWEQVQIDPSRRAETLCEAEFIRLFQALQAP